MDYLSYSLLFLSYHLIFTAFDLLILALIFIFSSKFTAKKLNLPSVIGNLFQVARMGKPFFQYVRELIPEYHSILTLKMCTRTMIIINSAKLAYEALIEKGQIFASRLRENLTRTIFSCNKFTVNAASTALCGGPCGGTCCRTCSASLGSGSFVGHRRWQWIILLTGSRRRQQQTMTSFRCSRTPG
ncbi:UNVERIFIED_CONTAM: cytochrome [Sesamum radiatum]|uniref:Cytochrome n=1 Tax=Sesamum radiatum TaxID=300843 RepID=A0AAW2K6E4_SESRA